MKAIILTGGEGSRLQPITTDINKCAMEVKGTPLLFYSLNICNQLAKRRVIERDVIVVIGYRAQDIMALPLEEFDQINVRFQLQNYPKCVGAIKSVEKYIDDDHFFLMLGDEVFINPIHNKMFTKFINGKYDGMIGYVNNSKANVKKTYTFKTNDEGIITAIKEKPSDPYNSKMGTGNCILPKKFFEFIPSDTENLGAGDFVSIIGKMVDSRYSFGTYKIADNYVNVNTIDELRKVEDIL